MRSQVKQGCHLRSEDGFNDTKSPIYTFDYHNTSNSMLKRAELIQAKAL